MVLTTSPGDAVGADPPTVVVALEPSVLVMLVMITVLGTRAGGVVEYSGAYPITPLPVDATGGPADEVIVIVRAGGA